MTAPLLAADIGNSHTVVGLVADGEVLAEWRVATDDRRTSDEWAVLLRGLLGERAAAIDGIAVCSTVPAVLHEWRDMLARHFGDVPHVDRRARRPDRHPGPHRQPARGRHRPDPQRARRRHRPRRPGHRRRLRRHRHHLRRRRRRGASTSAARSRPASSCRWRRSVAGGAQLRKVELLAAALGGRQATPSRRSSPGWSSASPARSRDWSPG